MYYGLYKFYTFWAALLHLGYIMKPGCVPNTLLTAVVVVLGAELLMYCRVMPKHFGLHILSHYLPLFVVCIISTNRDDRMVGKGQLQLLGASLLFYLLMYGGNLGQILAKYRNIRSELFTLS